SSRFDRRLDPCGPGDGGHFSVERGVGGTLMRYARLPHALGRLLGAELLAQAMSLLAEPVALPTLVAQSVAPARVAHALPASRRRAWVAVPLPSIAGRADPQLHAA